MNSIENIWQGKKVRLRGFEAEDWELYYEWSKDTEIDRLSGNVIFPASKEYFKKQMAEKAAKSPHQGDDYRFLIENLAGEVVGDINSQMADRRNGTFSFGMGVRREHWRKGYAREAIWLLLRFFFLELGYQKVHSGVYAFNEGSLALHRNLGFTEEGRLRRMVYSEGAYHDEIVFGMTREEFEANENINRG
jgi:RimJ/RimL family protein N-acetyltransferase